MYSSGLLVRLSLPLYGWARDSVRTFTTPPPSLTCRSNEISCLHFFPYFLLCSQCLIANSLVLHTATTGQMLRLKSFSQFIRDFRVRRCPTSHPTTLLIFASRGVHLYYVQLQWLFTFGLAMTSLIDLIITASLCFYLHSSRTGYSTVDDVINRIIVYTINNGLMTT